MSVRYKILTWLWGVIVGACMTALHYSHDSITCQIGIAILFISVVFVGVWLFFGGEE